MWNSFCKYRDKDLDRLSSFHVEIDKPVMILMYKILKTIEFSIYVY